MGISLNQEGDDFVYQEGSTTLRWNRKQAVGIMGALQRFCGETVGTQSMPARARKSASRGAGKAARRRPTGVSS